MGSSLLSEKSELIREHRVKHHCSGEKSLIFLSITPTTI